MAEQFVSDDRNVEWKQPSGFEEVLELQWLLDVEAGPNAHVLDIEPHGEIEPHIQEADQWIVVVDGRCMVSGEEIRAIGVHYVTEGTPYGPVVAGPDGATVVVLRDEPSESEFVNEAAVGGEIVRGPTVD